MAIAKSRQYPDLITGDEKEPVLPQIDSDEELSKPKSEEGADKYVRRMMQNNGIVPLALEGSAGSHASPNPATPSVNLD